MKIVPVFLRYDYGKKSRGDSLEYTAFYSALKQLTEEVHPFWYDEYLTKRNELQKDVIKFIENIDPDIVIFILMSDEFSFKTLDYLKRKYITLNWFADDQWRFEDFTSHYAPHFSYAVTTDKFALFKYRKIGYNNVIASQWASFEGSSNLNFEKINHKYDVSFVGGASGYRKYIIHELSRNGIEVDCFGSGWKRGRVSYEAMADIFKTSRINLNISNSASYDIRALCASPSHLYELLRSKKRVEQIKARNFEIPAFGGFQLTNYVPFIEDYYIIGREIAVYSSIEDLMNKIYYYLNEVAEREKIVENGFKRTLEEHTYENRLRLILGKIEADL
jgi:spore maturation protein CgeB